MSRSASAPASPITTGDRVRRRGLGFIGTVEHIKNDWITMQWDDGRAPRLRPLIVHRAEMERA